MEYFEGVVAYVDLFEGVVSYVHCYVGVIFHLVTIMDYFGLFERVVSHVECSMGAIFLFVTMSFEWTVLKPLLLVRVCLWLEDSSNGPILIIIYLHLVIQFATHSRMTY